MTDKYAFIDAALEAMQKDKLDPLRTGSRPGRDGLITDGKVHSFSTHPRRENDTAGWYAIHLYDDGIVAVYGDLREWGDRHEVFSKFDDNVPRERRERALASARRSQKEADDLRRARAAELAGEVWKAAPPAVPEHPYLARKRVGAAGLGMLPVQQIAALIGYSPSMDGDPLQGDVLVAPFRVAGPISTIEMIDVDGRKCALKNGTKRGASWAQADLSAEREIGFAEGIATAKTVMSATGTACVSVGSVGNFAAVLESFRSLYPRARQVVYADNGNGHQTAVDAAERFGAELVSLPEDVAGTDFNDMAAERGEDAVRDWIAELRRPRDRLYFGSANKPQEIDMVLPGLVAGTLGLLVGQGAIGKSYFSLDIAVGVALGRDIANVPDFCTAKAGDVGILFGEDGPKIVLDRMYALRRARQFTEAEIALLDEKVDVRSKLGQSILITQFDFKVAQAGPFLGELTRFCDGKRLTIIDPLALMHDGDERDNGQMTRVMNTLYHVANSTGCAILVLHHMGKGNGERESWAASRGASAVSNSARWQLNMTPPAKEDMTPMGISESARDRFVKCEVSKHNYGPKFPNFWLRRDDGGVPNWVDPKEARSAPSGPVGEADEGGDWRPPTHNGYGRSYRSRNRDYTNGGDDPLY